MNTADASSRIRLTAGPLSLQFDPKAGDLRYVRLGRRMVLLRVYSAARGAAWGTAPAVLSDLRSDIGANRFHIAYTCHNRLGALDFLWRGDIHGDADGTVRFSMDGVAQRTFERGP